MQKFITWISKCTDEQYTDCNQRIPFLNGKRFGNNIFSPTPCLWEGQAKLKDATVMIVGCGGFGSTCSTILSRSGVGHLILIDCDEVSISNIHRRFLYTQNDIGKSKSKTATSSPLLCLSDNVPVITHIDKDTAYQLIEEHQPNVLMDCTDNFEVRYAVNHACVRASVPMAFGSITAGQGQVSVYCDLESDPKSPCISCIHPQVPQQLPSPPPVVPGICSIVGTIQA
ncbi:molybdopterin-synthase adenylyltransferase MoeB [Histomonas meleagridis]|uniref:molybdopterin-synthase adenylyltransferase MoeB n=1 Tax=Histomonas meleagridis TaxID=135588 RepID=UPI00355ABC01|nr:molybdopterin-synthase adenylyltransferase MoeB [Histomonas meleagridis]KAH0801989.1 molybdopterin-synthase adenylyltransferase MoeB [Histomonas meleagridis]